jgi:hypothetical protein
MKHARDELTQNLVERLGWQVAQGADASSSALTPELRPARLATLLQK